MSIYKKDTVTTTYPAYNIVKREAHVLMGTDIDVIEITHGEQVIFNDRIYTVGTVFSSYIADNECPLAGYQRALDLGHDTVWLNANCVTISASKQVKKTCLSVDLETVYHLEGHTYKIEKTSNDNLKFVNS